MSDIEAFKRAQGALDVVLAFVLPGPEEGMSADQRGLQHAGRKLVMALLEHHAQTLGNGAPAPVGQRPAIQPQAPMARRP